MTQPASSLPRVLGPWLATAIVVGCVIGTGVFKKAKAVSENVPDSGPAIAVWVVVGLLTLCGAMALAEVASLFPRAGGNYVFLREAYGPIFGFLWGWVEFWFLRVASIAALASVFSDSLNDVLKLALKQDLDVLSFWPRQVASAVIVAGLGLLAARGTKLGASVQFGVTVVKVGSIIALMVLPVVVLVFGLDSPVKPDAANFRPVWPADWGAFRVGAFAAAMVAVMWPYNGWSNVSSIAGEVKEPQRNVPIAFVGGLLILIALYSLVNVSYYLTIPGREMATLERHVATEASYRLLGSFGLLAASAAIMISVFGAIGGNMLVGPRSLFALGRDGLAPSALGTVHAKYQTPFVATILLTGVSVAFIFVAAAYSRMEPPPASGEAPPKALFDILTDFVVFGAGALETLAVASIFVFRRRHPADVAALPYRCPGYPVVPGIFVLCMIAVLGNMFLEPNQRREALSGLGFIAVGAVVYIGTLVGRRNNRSGFSEARP
jgi:APA family basic amino acid/polyamine antiporter